MDKEVNSGESMTEKQNIPEELDFKFANNKSVLLSDKHKQIIAKYMNQFSQIEEHEVIVAEKIEALELGKGDGDPQIDTGNNNVFTVIIDDSIVKTDAKN